MKKTIPKRLREKDLYPVVRQFTHVNTGSMERRHIADGNAINPLHDHNRLAGVIPVNSRHHYYI